MTKSGKRHVIKIPRRNRRHLYVKRKVAIALLMFIFVIAFAMLVTAVARAENDHNVSSGAHAFVNSSHDNPIFRTSTDDRVLDDEMVDSITEDDIVHYSMLSFVGGFISALGFAAYYYECIKPRMKEKHQEQSF